MPKASEVPWVVPSMGVDDKEKELVLPSHTLSNPLRGLGISIRDSAQNSTRQPCGTKQIEEPRALGVGKDTHMFGLTGISGSWNPLSYEPLELRC